MAQVSDEKGKELQLVSHLSGIEVFLISML